MRGRHAHRIWLAAGATVIALLAAASWFLLIGPKFVERDEAVSQADDTQAQVVVLRNRISELKQQQAALTTLQSDLKKKQTALPSDAAIPAFLNLLQKSGDDADVDVAGISIGAPTQLTDPDTVWAMPITLTAEGSTDNLERFLTTLQTGRSRALLIEGANVNPASGAGGTTTAAAPIPTATTLSTTGSLTATATAGPTTTKPTGTTGTGTTAGALSISLTLKAFVAPPVGAGTPAATTK